MRNLKPRLVMMSLCISSALCDIAHAASSESLPYIVATMRMDDAWIARLKTNDGSINNYKMGDAVNGNMRVLSIMSKGVTIMKGKKSIDLDHLPVIHESEDKPANSIASVAVQDGLILPQMLGFLRKVD